MYSLILAVDSILNSDYPDLEVIVVDDFSTEDTKGLLGRLYDGRVIVIKNRSERLLSFSRNEGFKFSKGEYILNLDDDCIVYKDTIIELVRIINKDTRIGCIGPSVLDRRGRVMYQGAYAFPFFLPIRASCDRVLGYSDFLLGTISLWRRDVLMSIGGYDYINFPFQAEDADLCLRAKKSGYMVVCARWVKAVHLSDRLLKVTTKLRAYEAAKGRILLCKRHLTKVKLLAYLLFVNQIIVGFYLLYFLNKPNLFKYYLRGLVDGLRTHKVTMA